jgi:hypothetical protein
MEPDTKRREDEPYAEIVVIGERRRTRRDDEPTKKLELDRKELRPEDKLVVGYLTMEQHGMFASLSPSEQRQATENLRR